MIRRKNREIEKKKDDAGQGKDSRLKWKPRSWIRLLLILVILITAGSICWKIRHMSGSDVAEKGKDFLIGREGGVVTVTESVLEKSVKRSEMYTAEYPYNGYAVVYEEDEETVKYYTAYEGTVKAGIDVSKIQVFLDKEAGIIIIRLPQITVAEPWVDPGTMEYIFENEKYNTETVAQEAYKAALADLSERVSADTKLADTAAENAKISAKALVEPWVNQVDEDVTYRVEVLLYGEGNEDE